MKQLLALAVFSLSAASPNVKRDLFQDNTYLPPTDEHCDIYLQYAGMALEKIGKNISPIIGKIQALEVSLLPETDFDEESRLRIYRTAVCPVLCDSRLEDGNKHCNELEFQLTSREKQKVFILKWVYMDKIKIFRAELNNVMSYINKILQYNIVLDDLPGTLLDLIETDMKFQFLLRQLYDGYAKFLENLTSELQEILPMLTMPGSSEPLDLQKLTFDEIPQTITDIIIQGITEVMISSPVREWIGKVKKVLTDFENPENVGDYLNTVVKLLNEKIKKSRERDMPSRGVDQLNNNDGTVFLSLMKETNDGSGISNIRGNESGRPNMYDDDDMIDGSGIPNIRKNVSEMPNLDDEFLAMPYL